MITKGKWKVDGGSNKRGDLFIWKDGEYYGGHAIATVHGEIEEGAGDNALLIAAAPDLLEAANEILSDFNQFGEVLQQGDNGEYGLECAIGRLASAITKAEK